MLTPQTSTSIEELKHQFNSQSTLVFIHGLHLGTASYKHVPEQFGWKKSVIIDLIQFVKQADDCSVPSLACAIFQHLDDLGVDQISLIGNGLGASVAFQMGLLQPKRVENEILISLSNTKKNEKLINSQRQLIEFIATSMNRRDHFQTVFNTFFGTDVTSEVYWDRLVEYWNNLDYLSYIKLFERNYGESHFTNQEIILNTVPNFIIHAESDIVTPPSDSKKFGEIVGTNVGQLGISRAKNDIDILFNPALRPIIEEFNERPVKAVKHKAVKLSQDSTHQFKFAQLSIQWLYCFRMNYSYF